LVIFSKLPGAVLLELMGKQWDVFLAKDSKNTLHTARVWSSQYLLV